MKRKTNFDKYLDQQLKDRDLAARFKKAGEAWDIAIKLAALRKESGLSQKELAQLAGTTQQQVSRLESPAYEGHSLSILRRVAGVLGATVEVELKTESISMSLNQKPDMVRNNESKRDVPQVNKAVYPFGASLKDLGKKWFAFFKNGDRGN